MVHAQLDNTLGRHLAGEIEFDIGHLAQLLQAVIGDSLIGRQAGQFGLQPHAPAGLVARFGNDDIHAAFGQGAGAFETRRSGTDDQDAFGCVKRRNAFRMPSPPPLLAHGRVLGAADRRDRHVA